MTLPSYLWCLLCEVRWAVKSEGRTTVVRLLIASHGLAHSQCSVGTPLRALGCLALNMVLSSFFSLVLCIQPVTLE